MINLKSIIKSGLLLFAFVCLATVNADAQQKIGHTNSQALFAEMPSTKAAQSELADFSKQLNDQYTNKEKVLQQELADAQKQAGDLTPNQLKELEAKFQQKGLDLEKTRREFETKLLEKEKVLMEPLSTKFTDAIAAVAKENGYSYIVDSTALLHALDSDDVTALIKTKLGM